jgi:phenylacetate-coenzyme A ligase PaaK-like adenylate-forming protein
MCDEAKVDLQPMDRLDQVQRVPILEKEMLRSRVGDLLTEPIGRMDVHKTSGSTGIPLKIYRAPEDAAYNNLSWRRAYRLNGLELNHITRYRVMRIVHPVDFYGIQHPNLMETSVNDSTTAIAKVLTTFKPSILEGYPTDLLMLAKQVQGTTGYPRVSKIFTHSELLVPAAREQIERTFEGRITDLYGSQELGCIAWQCPSGHYHVNDDLFLLEVVDHSGRATFSGEGEVLVTAYFSFGLPLIRYRLGDVLAVSARRERCSVGLTQVDVFEGKVYDFLQTNNGAMVSPHTVRQTIAKQRGIGAFRVVQHKDRNVTVILQPGGGFNDGVSDELQRDLRQIFGTGVSIDVEKVTSLDRSGTNKFKSVEREV